MSKSTLRNLIIAIVLAAISSGVFGLMVYYVFDKGGKLAGQIEVLEASNAQEASFIKSQRLAEDTQVERALLQSYFLARASDSIDFLNKVEALAPTLGISLETKGLENIVDETNNSEWIEAGFSFSGSRDNVQKFIKVLETLPYVARVNEVMLVSKTTTQWTAEVTMQVKVLAYDE